MIDIAQMEERLRRVERGVERLAALDWPAEVTARYSSAGGQSIPNAAYTIVNYDSLGFDSRSAVTTGASWKFTAPVAGYYAVRAGLLLAATTTWNLGEELAISCYKNGVLEILLGYRVAFDSASSINAFISGVGLVYLAAGDYIDIRVYQSSGAALALYSGAGAAPYNYCAVWKVV